MVQSMYQWQYVTCRLRIRTHRGRIETKILIKHFSSSYASCRNMPVPVRPLWVQMRRRQGTYRYTRTFLTYVRANLVPLSSLALLKCDVTRANGASLLPRGGRERVSRGRTWVLTSWKRGPPQNRRHRLDPKRWNRIFAVFGARTLKLT